MSARGGGPSCGGASRGPGASPVTAGRMSRLLLCRHRQRPLVTRRTATATWRWAFTFIQSVDTVKRCRSTDIHFINSDARR